MIQIPAGKDYATVDIPVKEGATYIVTLPCEGPATGYVELYTRTAKGKVAIHRVTGPGTMRHRFQPAKNVIGIVLVSKGKATWGDGNVIDEAEIPVEPPPVVVPPPAPPRKALIGMNLSNAEMGGAVPGTLNKDYAYPADKYLDWVISTGVKLVRLCFKWRRLITSTSATTFKASDIPHIIRIVKYLNAAGITVILDMHDYGKYQGNAIGHPSTPIEFFARTWGMFGETFKDADVWFGFMNEPNGQDYRLMQKGSNAAIQSIRAAGAKQKILVPGMNWSGAHSFVKSSAPIFEEIPVVDPLDNWAFEVHQYLDSDSSGTHVEVVAGKGAKVLVDATEWCRARGFDLFLGEHGVGRDAASLKEERDMLAYLHANSDVWVGHTYWAAGAWWKADYIRAIGPDKSNEQLRVMMEFA